MTNIIADPAPAAEFPEIDPTIEPVDGSADGVDTAGDAGESGVIGLVAAALAGLIPIGIAIAALVWWRRRSRQVADAPMRAQAAASPPIAPGAPKVIEPKARTMPQQSTVAAPKVVAPQSTWAPQRPSAPVTYGGSNVTVAERPVAAPARNDERYAEPVVPEDDVRSSYVPDASPAAWSVSASRDRGHRRELLESMVDAQPDARNPFTSRKARMRRARLILASMENA
ncbi:hypothetical protein WAB17_00535 [Parerythrobacter aurantius]|uniref:hypothetical protein n=1 Tax=Parerythrobacter aurantius TaxID=3127706 RepID=UPI00324E72C2